MVTSALKALHEAGYRPNSKFLHSKNPEASRLVSETIGYEVTLQRVIFYANEFYGGLPQALEAAGIAAESVILTRLPEELWTKDKIKAALKAWVRAGYEVSAKAMRAAANEKQIELVSESVGFHTRPRIVLEKAREEFGSLTAAIWDKELVKKIFVALYKAGVNPNEQLFKNKKMDFKAREVVDEAAGFPVTPNSFRAQAKRLFGSYKKAIEASGLPVKEVYRTREPVQPWTKDLVYSSLRALYDAGFRPKARFLSESRDLEATDVLTAHTGFETTLTTLYNKAKEFHRNDFDLALTKADLPVELIKQIEPRDPWSRPLVHIGLRALYYKGFKPNGTFLQKSKDLKAKRVLSDAVGFETKLSALYLQAVNRHGGHFQKALVDAGLPVRKIVGKVSGKFWTRGLTHLALQTLYENGYNPTATFLVHERDIEAEELLSEALGFPTTLNLVFKKSQHFHGGNFQLALRSAGLPVGEIINRFSTAELDRETAILALQVLYVAGYFPNSTLLKYNNKKLQDVLTQRLGFPLTLKTLYDFLRREFNGLSAALQMAGLHPSLDKKIVWTDQRVLEGLSGLYSRGINPSAKTLRTFSPKIFVQLSSVLGFRTSPSGLLRESRERFGSLWSALLKGGLPAHEIVEYVPGHIDMMVGISYQREREVVEGEVRYTNYVGEAVESAEEILMKKDLDKLVDHILPPEDLEVGRALLQILTEMEAESLGPENIYDLLVNEYRLDASIRQVAGILQTLGESQELRELLSGD